MTPVRESRFAHRDDSRKFGVVGVRPISLSCCLTLWIASCSVLSSGTRNPLGESLNELAIQVEISHDRCCFCLSIAV
jgi:hypothetical protein